MVFSASLARNETVHILSHESLSLLLQSDKSTYDQKRCYVKNKITIIKGELEQERVSTSEADVGKFFLVFVECFITSGKRKIL